MVVGVPMLTSVGNLQFWLHLCNATHADGAAALVRDFKAHEAEGKEALLNFCASYNRDLVRKVSESARALSSSLLMLPRMCKSSSFMLQVLSTRGVAGLHIMPLSKVARQQVQQMLQDGVLPHR